MSAEIRLRANGVRGFALVGALAALICLSACGELFPGAGSGGPAASSTARPVATVPKAAVRPELAVLGERERRTALIVVPGDALVEVDGQPAYRRDGVIELTGEIGKVRRVRVWKGTKVMEEKPVTIQEPQPSPPLLDLNEEPPPKPVLKTTRKKPATYGGFEEG